MSTKPPAHIPLMLKDFLERLPDIVKGLVEDKCNAVIDQRDFRNFKSPFLVPFSSPVVREVMPFLAVKPDVTPLERVTDTFDNMNRYGPSLFINFDPEEINPEGILKRAALGLTMLICQQIIGVTPSHNPGTPGTCQLLGEIGSIAKLKGSLETEETSGEYILREEGKAYLRELLGSGSLIDSHYLIEAIGKYKPKIGQYT